MYIFATIYGVLTRAFGRPLWPRSRRRHRLAARRRSRTTCSSRPTHRRNRPAAGGPGGVGPGTDRPPRCDRELPARLAGPACPRRVLAGHPGVSSGVGAPGEAFPKARPGEASEAFGERLAELARADLVTSLDGLYSGQPVTIPPEITAVLIQWAANALETEAPYVVPIRATRRLSLTPRPRATSSSGRPIFASFRASSYSATPPWSASRTRTRRFIG